jgi:uncharacterized membrane protein
MHSIEASILVDVPVETCYSQWMDFERFPEFMRRVVAVRPVGPMELLPRDHRPHVTDTEDPQKDYTGAITAELINEIAAHGNRIWHWEVKGPLGQIFNWTAGIVVNLPNHSVSWASTPEQDLPNTGSVNFLKAPPDKHHHQDRTLMTVTMSFSPPAGVLGEFLSDMTHYGDNLLCEALEEFKAHVELQLPNGLASGQAVPSHFPKKAMTTEEELRHALGTNGVNKAGPR